MLRELRLVLHRIALSKGVATNDCPKLSCFHKFQDIQLVFGWNSPCCLLPTLWNYSAMNNAAWWCWSMCTVVEFRCCLTLHSRSWYTGWVAWKRPPRSVSSVHSVMQSWWSASSAFSPFRTATLLLNFPDLWKLGIACPRAVAFCQKYTDCSQLNLALWKKLVGRFTHPPDYTDLNQFTLVDVYTRVSTIPMRGKVLNSFTNLNRTLWLLIATTAFGMGIDCWDFCTIIHWGVPSDIEQYVQETGRAGCDGY